jgi:hypothetical protein
LSLFLRLASGKPQFDSLNEFLSLLVLVFDRLVVAWPTHTSGNIVLGCGVPAI